MPWLMGLTIDLGALVANWKALADRAPGARPGAVVKADAYGCGLARVAPALWAAGCRTFFVAHLSEGIAARAILPEVQKVEGGGGTSLARVADLTSFTGETFGAG